MIAIIPARGGSKRIPRKNILDFLGKPMIAYAIETAVSTGLFSEIVVSTDDPEIAAVARKYGASVPFMRSSENSSDHATTFAVIEEVYDNYTKLYGDLRYACCIYPCTPLLKKEDIIRGFELLKKHEFDSVYPLVPYSTPIQRAFKISNNKLEFFYPEYISTRSQDLEKAYYDPGQFYWMDCHKVIEKKNILTDNSGCIIMDELHVQDIDNLTDWKHAELKYSMLNGL